MATGETMSVLADAAFERFAPDWTDEPSSDDEEMKRAFFSELEKKHGGPISAEELRLWSNALDEDDTDAEIAPVVEAAYSSAASIHSCRAVAISAAAALDAFRSAAAVSPSLASAVVTALNPETETPSAQ